MHNSLESRIYRRKVTTDPEIEVISLELKRHTISSRDKREASRKSTDFDVEVERAEYALQEFIQHIRRQPISRNASPLVVTHGGRTKSLSQAAGRMSCSKRRKAVNINHQEQGSETRCESNKANRGTLGAQPL